ncbi:FISUMP domain-containing protein [Mucilaginibacter lappiensis]|uniref:Uncharacterized protein (TIGR02145 family) n=1 Tax=Mucilaginibacter lappiensis TaxID=354630 RepID=A0A841JMZ9_9SPHI|nr:FISUMP domain-containing protein [Mucilaginibacter lappiensis]MBB6131652.1 uncharacterized protein (TIGR02145 family) [Mucilaginibacter lappiensis]
MFNLTVRITRYTLLVLMMITSLWIISCSKKNDPNTDTKSGGAALVNVNMSVADFEDATMPNLSSSVNGEPIKRQTQKIVLANGLTLIAELSAAPTKKASAQALAAIVTPLANGTVYRLLAYNKATGALVKQQDYARGSESSVRFALDEGTYTFVAYGVLGNNSTSNLPAINSPNLLSTANILGTSLGNQDLMYFTTDMKVVSTDKTMIAGSPSVNNVNVVLKHVFCQITTTIDDTATGYKITDVNNNNLNFTQHFPGASMKLADGSIATLGFAGNATTTSTISSTGFTATCISILNGNTTSSILTIPAFTIGSSTAGPFTQNNVKITPGVKYNLNLTITPSDFFLSYQGQQAAAIGGQVWMRYNLGVDQSANPNPDVNPTVNALNGNYYRWGLQTPLANFTTTTAINTTTPPPNLNNNAWNSSRTSTNNNDNNPTKNTTNDPCPAGYRMPTETEYRTLIANTKQNNLGPSAPSITTAKQFVSRRQINVLLTFPNGGWFNSSPGIRSGLWAGGFYWTSTPGGAASDLLFANSIGSIIVARTSYDVNTIRCIAENSATAIATGTRQ